MTKDVTQIWTDFQKELKDFIFAKTKNSADTDDILQEVFLKIIRNIDKVNQSKNLRQYLYGIVRNSVTDHFRSQKNISPDIQIDLSLTEDETQSLNSSIAECCIKPFIHKLPKNYKDTLLITEFQEVSQKELAQKLNISYSGAKSRVQRGKTKLKELILNCCAYESDVYGNLRIKEDKDCSCH
ncbi:MAG: sigma-70 family RNA polymerase sigma factor [Saprospiraceae bacterium]